MARKKKPVTAADVVTYIDRMTEQFGQRPDRIYMNEETHYVLSQQFFGDGPVFRISHFDGVKIEIRERFDVGRRLKYADVSCGFDDPNVLLEGYANGK